MRIAVVGGSSRVGGGMGAEGPLLCVSPPGLLVILRTLFAMVTVTWENWRIGLWLLRKRQIVVWREHSVALH